MSSSNYTISTWVEDVHDLRRFDITSGGDTVTNEFDPDFSGSGRKYALGIGSLAGVYLALGAIVFLVFTVANLIVCCTRSQKKTSRVSPGCCSRFFSFIFGARLWYIIGSSIIIALTAAALSQTGKFASDESDVISALDTVAGVFADAKNQASGVIVPNLQSSQYSASLLADYLTSQNLTGPATAMGNIATAAGAASTTAQSMSTYLGTVNSFIGNDDTGIKKSVSAVRAGGLAFTALLLAYLLFNVVVATVGRPCCAKSFRCMQPVFLIFVFLTFIFSAGFLVGSLVGSDACINPETSIHKVMVFANADNATVDSIDYYMACGGNPALPPAGALAEVINAESSISSAVTDVENFINTNQGQAWYTGEVAANMTTLNATMRATSAGVNALAGDVACQSISPSYYSMRDVACHDGTLAVIAAWLLGTVICITLTFMSISAVRLCKSHPGDATSPDDRAFDADSYVTRMSLPTTSTPTGPTVVAAPIISNSGTAASYGSYAAAQDWAGRR